MCLHTAAQSGSQLPCEAAEQHAASQTAEQTALHASVAWLARVQAHHGFTAELLSRAVASSMPSVEPSSARVRDANARAKIVFAIPLRTWLLLALDALGGVSGCVITVLSGA